jgi:hypothetical protein
MTKEKTKRPAGRPFTYDFPSFNVGDLREYAESFLQYIRRRASMNGYAYRRQQKWKISYDYENDVTTLERLS